MKKILGVIILTLFFNIVKPAYSKTITIAADPWCPFSCSSDNHEEGFLVDLFKAIFEKEGYKVEYKSMPWSRAITETRNGNLNAIVGAFKSDAPDFIFTNKEQISCQNCFFSLIKLNWKYKQIKDLTHHTVGLVSGYSYGENIDNLMKNNNDYRITFDTVSGSNSLENNIKKLLNRRITTFIEEKNVFNYSKNSKKFNIKESGCLEKTSSYIAFSPHINVMNDSHHYKKILENGMEKLTKNGELKKLKQKYKLN